MKKKILLTVSVLLLAAAIFGIGIYSVSLRKQKKRKQWMEAPEIHEGISVGGISVGGLTVKQAEQALQEQAEALLAGLRITLKVGAQQRELPAAEAGIRIDAAASAQAAYQLGREGNYEQLASEIESLRAGREIAPRYTVDRQTALQLAEALAGEYGTQPQNAWLEAAEGQVIYHEEQPGYTLEEEACYEALLAAAEAGEFTCVEIPLLEVQAEIGLAQFTPGLVQRSTATTSFDGTGDNRGQNIQKATELLDGLLLHDGEGFSMNAVLGDRTVENGWQQAPAIVDGGARREDQPGGGVCQVSTTLYHAVAKADLTVTYRRNHSAKVGYVAAGLDATINTGTIDFTWENHSGGDILLHAWIQEESKVVIEVYGLPFEGFEEIRLEAEHTGDIQPSGEMEILYDHTKEVGYEKVEVERQKGSTYTSYKLYYSGGEVIKKEKLADSKYNAQNGQKVIGTKETQ